ncbi:MAG: Ribosomal RNA small subunit methyltransferase A [Candidatus Nomurabacteria bacterium GW2011_GWB1_37_5]|nr:MAG: Ribosomal RNA small subunit methyltransferase A [Candidatus Nomurabacteria bacterium GW2011_GWB1_37_5]
MVLMVQHEVAQRILGGKESLLSISVKAYGEPKILMKVPARYFAPQPAVDSAVIVIKNISRKFFTENKLDEEKFWQIVKAGFAHKRKKLSSNLKNIISIENQTGRELGNKRAEDLSLAEWAEIAKNND